MKRRLEGNSLLEKESVSYQRIKVLRVKVKKRPHRIQSLSIRCRIHRRADHGLLNHQRP